MRQIMFGGVARYIDLLRTVAKFKKREQKASASLGYCVSLCMYLLLFSGSFILNESRLWNSGPASSFILKELHFGFPSFSNFPYPGP